MINDLSATKEISYNVDEDWLISVRVYTEGLGKKCVDSNKYKHM